MNKGKEISNTSLAIENIIIKDEIVVDRNGNKIPNPITTVNEIKNNKIKPINYIVVDFETSGLSIEEDDIVQMAVRYVKMFDGKIISNELAFNKFYYSDKIKNTEHIHHITEEMVKDQPAFSGDEESKDFLKNIIYTTSNEENYYFVAQYAVFELGFINRFIGGIDKMKVVDTRILAKYLWPEENHSQDNIAKLLGLEFETNDNYFEHRADYDTNVCAETLNSMINIIYSNKSI